MSEYLLPSMVSRDHSKTPKEKKKKRKRKMRHPLTARRSQFTQLLNYMLAHTVTLKPTLLPPPSTSKKTIESEETKIVEVAEKKRVRHCI